MQILGGWGWGGVQIRYIMGDGQVSYCKFYGRSKHETTVFLYLF